MNEGQILAHGLSEMLSKMDFASSRKRIYPMLSWQGCELG